MPPRRYRDAYRVCIYEETEGADYSSGLPAAITDPINHLDQIYWHSDLGYIEIFYNRVQSISFPARGTTPGTQKWTLPNHDHGSLPYGVLVVGDTQIPTAEPIQGSSAATRHVVLGVDENAVWIRELWKYGPLTATSMTFRAILFRPAPKTLFPHLSYEGPDRVVYGGGAFDTEKQYLRASPDAPDFWMTIGRTIDTTKAGYKGVRPNGAVKIFGSYTGSFSGSGFFGVSR